MQGVKCCGSQLRTNHEGSPTYSNLQKANRSSRGCCRPAPTPRPDGPGSTEEGSSLLKLESTPEIFTSVSLCSLLPVRKESPEEPNPSGASCQSCGAKGNPSSDSDRNFAFSQRVFRSFILAEGRKYLKAATRDLKEHRSSQ